MTHTTHTLPNGLRILHLPSTRPITWIGIAIDAGTRDELPDENGIAHFVEHMLFKGTTHRRSYHIISRLETIGGQLDAYTTKEETYIYAAVPARYTYRALDLLADIILNSTFPQHEIERERDVILDEIQSYNDTPSELIFDEFENLLYPSDPMGRNILGTTQTLARLRSEHLHTYLRRTYTPTRMLLFMMGSTPPDQLFRRAEHHFSHLAPHPDTPRPPHAPYTPTTHDITRDTYQAHCIIGNRCCSLSDPERLATILLNNILGGPSMTSRLNLAIRERNGLCYNIESNTTHYTDTGVWNIYFGTDPRNLNRTRQLCLRQIDHLATTPLTDRQLRQARQQLRGQILIANENLENHALAITKTHLHHQPIHTDDHYLTLIDTLTPSDLHTLARHLFDPDRLTTLTIHPDPRT